MAEYLNLRPRVVIACHGFTKAITDTDYDSDGDCYIAKTIVHVRIAVDSTRHEYDAACGVVACVQERGHQVHSNTTAI